LLKALYYDAVENSAHLSLGIGVLFLEHHLVLRLVSGELSLSILLFGEGIETVLAEVMVLRVSGEIERPGIAHFGVLGELF